MVAIMDRNIDRSIRGLPDPTPGTPTGERRRCVRQKLHTPVYASFNGPQTGMVVDLSELLDLHEDGFAVQTGERLEINRAVTLCLDLPETRNFLHGNGQVMWSDDTGRGGIKFSGLSEDSRQVLKEWLFANLLIACSNHAARTEQLAQHEEVKLPDPAPVKRLGSGFPIAIPTSVPTDVPVNVPITAPISAPTSVPISNRTGIVSSVEAVRGEVREIGDEVDAVFQLITERSLSLTGATGAALGFLTDGNMICRARAGEPAPPLGAPVDIKQGLSGECVRSGLLVSCEDTENDPRIDPEIGRALGIGSLMAVPIVSDFRVVGLLEVFSPHPRSFPKSQGKILDRLVEMIPKTHRDNLVPETVRPVNILSGALIDVASIDADSNNDRAVHPTHEVFLEGRVEVPEQTLQPVPEPIGAESSPKQEAPKLFSRWLHRGLLGLAVAVVAMVVGYLIGPLVEKRMADSAPASQSAVRDRQIQAKSLTDLRSLADQGDAEAQYQMGVRYDEGESVPKDDKQAVQWFQRAADQGHVDAQAHLGAYYWAGRGVPEDLSKAYMWSMIALAGGDDNSKSRLEGLASQMTRSQVSTARQQAEEWIRIHSQQAKSEAN
jgi:GAF domain/Sel1 repeat/PilZ domain